MRSTACCIEHRHRREVNTKNVRLRFEPVAVALPFLVCLDAGDALVDDSIFAGMVDITGELEPP
jgi:hypothetical protein